MQFWITITHYQDFVLYSLMRRSGKVRDKCSESYFRQEASAKFEEWSESQCIMRFILKEEAPYWKNSKNFLIIRRDFSSFHLLQFALLKETIATPSLACTPGHASPIPTNGVGTVPLSPRSCPPPDIKVFSLTLGLLSNIQSSDPFWTVYLWNWH
jgi:hypothetical protein